MRINSIWEELDGEISAGATGAWLSRFALPQPSAHPVLVAIEVSSRRRALLLPLSSAAIPVRREWPTCRGLEIFTVAIAGVPHLGVRLTDSTNADVFTALAEDIAPRIAAATSEKAAALALLNRLRRWQKFLAARSVDCSIERQRGLYGELHVLRRWIVPALGTTTSIACWRAPQASHQDFQLSGGAIEVKTTTAKQPQTIRITSERQLDDTGIRALYLVVVVLDEREVEGAPIESGDTLPGIVADLRRQLGVERRTREAFDDRLLDLGYLDADTHHFKSRRFALRSEHIFHVRQNFPRILESALPAGIGDVSYALSLAACASFAVPASSMISTIQETI